MTPRHAPHPTLTSHAEFLYACVQKTIEEDLPHETDFLRRYNAFHRAIEAFIDMPQRTIDLLFRFLLQNEGRLSQRARSREFDALTEAEVERIESIYGRTSPGGGRALPDIA